MKAVVFLNGPPENGLVRATRILAEAMEGFVEHRVIVLRRPYAAPGPSDMVALRGATADADVALFHYSPYTNYLWGARGDRVHALEAAIRAIRCPAVVYLHDVQIEPAEARMRNALARAGRAARSLRDVRGAGMEVIRAALRAPRAEVGQLRRLARAGARFLVSNAIEHGRMRDIGLGDRTSVQPHFIEARAGLIAREEAKAQLGFRGLRVISLLGFIFKNKGHDLAIRMLPHLPDDVRLVFAGGGNAADHRSYETEIRRIIDELGLRARVLVTGYIDDAVMDLYLSATDVAVAPFVNLSASGSLATWLATPTPIVGTDLPLVREYAAAFGPTVTPVSPRTPGAFADAVRTAFDTPPAAFEPRAEAVKAYAPEQCAARLFRTLGEHGAATRLRVGTTA